ncbi:MAG TPA: diguanylate cyclase [Gemmatimonadaceae bacterium]|nr:diguanylate cyclase [Gemmatimonadaceae bacterium]
MSGGADKQRLLFVAGAEDVLAFRRVATALGYDVDVASTAGEAVEMGQRHEYPVVVIDLELRGVDGYAVADAIGSKSLQSAFLLMTAQGIELGGGRSASDGAIAGLVSKPWEDSDLAAKLALAADLNERRAASRGSEGGRHTSVLVIEDNAEDTLLLRRPLERVPGVTVVVTKTLAGAMKLLHDQRFDVIITDLGLPDARGVDTVLRLRASSPESAIIVCTGIDDESLALKLVHLGAQECIAKGRLSVAEMSRVVAFAKERKRFELRLVKMAYYDSLTGLANRTAWHEHARGALVRARRRKEGVAVMMIDLDGFKPINDTHGHVAGDVVLRECAHRLLRLVREFDTVGRFGGDEFAVLLADVDDLPDVQRLAALIRRDLRMPVRLSEGTHVVVGASVGVAVFPENGDSPEALLASADAAMYEAKRAAKVASALES